MKTLTTINACALFSQSTPPVARRNPFKDPSFLAQASLQLIQKGPFQQDVEGPFPLSIFSIFFISH